MKKTFVIILCLAFMFPACGGKEKIKPSADSIITQNSIRVINLIKDAYQKKDKTALMENLSPELAEDIIKELFFERAELSLTPRMVKLKNSTVRINLNWHGTWAVKDNTAKNRGVAVFVLEGDPIKLVHVEGDNPFLTPAVK